MAGGDASSADTPAVSLGHASGATAADADVVASSGFAFAGAASAASASLATSGSLPLGPDRFLATAATSV
jgi:hypothetical protein